MADTKISALTDGATANATDRIPLARSPFASGDNRYVTPAYIGTYLAINTLAAGTITTDQPMTLTQTWNAGGVTFTGFKVNCTDTASAGASRLMDIQVGGTSRFLVQKDGTVQCLYGSFTGYTLTPVILMRSDTAELNMGVSDDVRLFRDAAGVFAQRNSTNAQAFRVYNTYTDASNYERADIYFTGNRFTIGTQNAGTGSQHPLDIYGSNVSIKAGSGGGTQVAAFLTSSIQFSQPTRPPSDLGSDQGITTARFKTFYVGQGIQGAGTTKTLTESAATGLCDIALASGARTGGVLHYTIEADDGTDFQTRTGMAYFTAVNKAGAITTGIQVVGTEGVAVSAGTLTVTITNATGASKITLQANAVSSLTQTTLRCKWFVQTHDTATITAL